MQRQLLSFILPLLLLAGCAGGGSVISYEASNNRTTFDTGALAVARGTGGGYGSRTSILMRASARCSGLYCTPKRVALSFSVEGGSSDLAISNRAVTIVADGKEFSGGRRNSWNRMSDVSRSEGLLTRVSLPLADLAAIANASSLEGKLGETTLDLRSVQPQLQEFVQAARNPKEAAKES